MQNKVRRLLIALALFTLIASIALPLHYHLRTGANDLTLQSPPSIAVDQSGTVSSQIAPIDQATRARINNAYAKLPLRFEANQGQTDQSVTYTSRGPGYSLFLTSGEAV